MHGGEGKVCAILGNDSPIDRTAEAAEGNLHSLVVGGDVDEAEAIFFSGLQLESLTRLLENKSRASVERAAR